MFTPKKTLTEISDEKLKARPGRHFPPDAHLVAGFSNVEGDGFTRRLKPAPLRKNMRAGK